MGEGKIRQLDEKLKGLIEGLVEEKLTMVRGKVETVLFVNSIVEELKTRGMQLDEELEALVRPYVVDVLWRLRKRGIITFDMDLTHFTVTEYR